MTTGESCVFCEHREFNLLFEAPAFDDSREKYNLYDCKQCHLAVIKPLPSPEKLAACYSAAYYGGGDKKFTGPLEWLVRKANAARARKLIRLVPKRDEVPRVLDIGCGRGNFLRAMAEAGFDGYGTELGNFEFGPEHQARKGRPIVYRHGALEEIGFEGGFFDAVSIWHVLEHVRDPWSTVQEIARVLKPGGVAAIAVPNFGSRQARMFGPNWFHLDLPRHLYHFTNETMGAMLERAGLEILERSTASPDQNIYGFVQSAENAALPARMSNRLYSLLKRGRSHGRAHATDWVSTAPLAAALLPVAVVEDLSASLSDQGGTLVCYARKQI